MSLRRVLIGWLLIAALLAWVLLLGLRELWLRARGRWCAPEPICPGRVNQSHMADDDEASMSNVDVEDEFDTAWRSWGFWLPFYSAADGEWFPRRKLFYLVWLLWALPTGLQTREVMHVSAADEATFYYTTREAYFSAPRFAMGLVLTYVLALGVFKLGGWTKTQIRRGVSAVRSS